MPNGLRGAVHTFSGDGATSEKITQQQIKEPVDQIFNHVFCLLYPLGNKQVSSISNIVAMK